MTMMRRSVALLVAALSLILARISATVLVAGDDEIPDTADFVIVGGGTAGCVLASRLCTDLPKASIVLLERGAPRNEAEDFYVTAPRLNEAIYGNAGDEGVDVFNYFPSEPNSNLVDPATGIPGRTIDLIDAATIGGASNAAFQWTYPLSGTVDEWGINGLDTATANSLFERAAGVIGVAQPPPELRQDYVQDVLNAHAKANYTIKEEQIPGEGGFTAEVNFVTIDDAGRRRSSYTQYLLPALLGVCKQRLTVIQDVTVTKLVPSSDDNSTIDTVEYVSSSSPDLANPKSIEANKEIILSAGPYGSPKLLLLSGIGPRNDLEGKGISPILADLPVGQRTQLQPSVPAVGRYYGRPLASFTNTSLLTEEAKQQFLAGEGGPFGVASSATVGKRDTLGYHSTKFLSLRSSIEPYFSMFCFLNPVGYGNLTIAEGANPLAEPIVHTDVLGNPQDFGAALQCAEEFRTIIEKGFEADFGMSAYGPSSSIPSQSWVASTAITNWHFVGGSAVGSVVDGDFKVMGGLTGLRVIDSSVIPKLTVSAGVLSSVYMLAELASDKLVEEYSSSFVSTDAAEVFPLAFALVMLCVSVFFSMWVIVSNTFRSAPKEEEIVRPQLTRKSSWVANSIQTLLTSGRWSSSTKIPARNDCVEEMEGPCAERTTIRENVPKDEDKTAAGTKPSALLSWAQVTCSYPGSKASDQHVTSLQNSFGEMRSTELTAIMGGSGSGKSTLLDILSGRKTLGNIAGKLSVHGEVLDDIRAQAMDEGGALRSVAAYVPQQEAFFPTQTAEEAVAFAANLKLGRDPRGDKVRWSRIQSVLREVGLSPETCKRPIGGELAGGIVIRGLSGGERKRLAVACALALKPRLLFLDEITSGLDSENALAITKLLKRLCASRNVAAMMVIHQPNGALFREFDRLVLLHKGKTVFSDDTSRLPELYEDVFKTEMPEWYDVPSNLMTQVIDLPPNELISDAKELVPTTGHGGHVAPPGAFWKFRAVFYRNLTNHYVRNITNLASRLCLYGATSLIDGLLFWQVADIAGGVNVGVEISTVVGALTFIILVSYLLPFAMLPVFVYDKKFFLAESGLGLYSPWLYCLSQIILETWVIVLAATIESCIVIPMCGLWNPAMARWESFFTFLGTLIVSGLTGSVLVLFHAIVLPSQDLAFLAGSGAVTISLALSGGFVPFPSIEAFISWLQWASPCKYTLQALALTFFRGTTYEDLVNEIYAFDKPATVSCNIGVLIAFFAALAGGTMFALSTQREVR